MWFGRGCRSPLIRGEYGQALTGTTLVVPEEAFCTDAVRSGDILFHAIIPWDGILLRHPDSTSPRCERKPVVTRELSILRSALARGPPD